MSPRRVVLAALGTLLALLTAWQAAVSVLGVPSILLPSPLEVGAALAGTYPRLFADAGVTALTAILGLLAGCLVGGALAFAMTTSRRSGNTPRSPSRGSRKPTGLQSPPPNRRSRPSRRWPPRNAPNPSTRASPSATSPSASARSTRKADPRRRTPRAARERRLPPCLAARRQPCSGQRTRTPLTPVPVRRCGCSRCGCC